jgi:hypothetical protein
MRLCIVPHVANKPPLAEDRVRFIGDEVAAVAADSEDIAEEALDLIEVEYEELPGVFDPREAMKPDAIKIHEEGNIAIHISRSYGDVEKAFKESDHIPLLFGTPWLYCPSGAIGQPDGLDDDPDSPSLPKDVGGRPWDASQ